jgi:hypothetical protein
VKAQLAGLLVVPVVKQNAEQAFALLEDPSDHAGLNVLRSAVCPPTLEGKDGRPRALITGRGGGGAGRAGAPAWSGQNGTRPSSY